MPGILKLSQRPMTRRTAVSGATGVAAITIFGGARSDVTARQGTPVAQPSGDDDAVALLTEAATAMTELDTFVFTVVTARGETTILEGFTLEEIHGVVRRPMDFETVVTVSIPFATIDLTAVGLDGEVWIELPEVAGQVGGWQSLGRIDGQSSSTNADAFSLISLLNPDVLILEAVKYIDNATIRDTGDIDGVEVTYVAGTVDFGAIASQLLDDAASLPTQVSEAPVDLTIAIDGESLVREIEIMGPLLASESDDVIRLVTFSEFNEPVEIERPDVG